MSNDLKQSFEQANTAAINGELQLAEVITLADRLTAAGDRALAIELYRNWAAATSSPLKFAALFNLGVILSHSGEVNEAIQAYQSAIQLKPDFAEARFNLATTLHQSKMQDLAEQQWLAIIEQPQSADRSLYIKSLNQLANIYISDHKLDAAEQMLERSLVANQSQPDVLKEWVNLRKRQARWPEYKGKSLNILVYAPDYRENSAGIVVLHKLCHLLNEAGHHATVSTPVRASHYIYDDSAFTRDAVAILPDVATRADCPNEKAVRWVLLYPGALQRGDTVYEEELIFTYFKIYYPSAPEFFISSLDRDLFSNQNLPRTIPVAKYVGKFTDDNQFPDVPLITRTWPETRPALAEFLNQVETLVCYDPVTALITEAILCGCKVVGPDMQPLTPILRDSDPVSILTDAIQEKWGL